MSGVCDLDTQDVLPANARMIPWVTVSRGSRASAPRECGDDPAEEFQQTMPSKGVLVVYFWKW